MKFIGIDPGVSGAIAIISTYKDDARVESIQLPTSKIKVGKKNRTILDLAQLNDIFLDLQLGEEITMCVIEKVHAMPKEGVVSAASFGFANGALNMCLVAHAIPHIVVTPQSWKKEVLSGIGKDKESARLFAQRMFPKVDLKFKKDHNRAEALLIALYAKRLHSDL